MSHLTARTKLLFLTIAIFAFSQTTAWALGTSGTGCVGCQMAPDHIVALRNHVPARSLLLWSSGELRPPAPPQPVYVAPTRLPRSDAPTTVSVAPVPSGGYVALGQKMAAARGWTGGEWEALRTLWDHESGWDPNNYGPWVGGARACGIPQRYPCNGLDAMSPTAQIQWGLDYIAARYGSPSVAWGGWYGRGSSY